jgi:hypothetical protein
MWARLFGRDATWMRCCIAIKIAGGQRRLLALPADRHRVEYAGPLATFIAQLAVSYLGRETRTLEHCGYGKAIVSYGTSSQDGVTMLDRSV